MTATRAILIVEDEYGLAELLRDMLTERGYDVSLAINGRLALEVLRERRIQLVLTDTMMPVMDGPELAKAMRADERHRDDPDCRHDLAARRGSADSGTVRGGPVEAVHARCVAARARGGVRAALDVPMRRAHARRAELQLRREAGL